MHSLNCRLQTVAQEKLLLLPRNILNLLPRNLVTPLQLGPVSCVRNGFDEPKLNLCKVAWKEHDSITRSHNGGRDGVATQGSEQGGGRRAQLGRGRRVRAGRGPHACRRHNVSDRGIRLCVRERA